MPTATLSGASIYYEVTGPASGEPLVLIMGWGAQMVYWNPEFIDLLVAAGFQPILFDNRDVGLSETFAGKPPYCVVDMARDVADLIRHLGHDSAHIAGQSMGGMIAQVLVLEFPEVLRSLNIIYSSPARDTLSQQDIEEMFPEMDYVAASRDEAIERFLERESHTDTGAGTNGFEGRMAEIAALHYDRGYHPDGVRRQFNAMQSMGDLRPRLHAVAQPTAVIHGASDVLLPISCGIDIAKAIENSELHVFADLGHEIARRLWPDFVRIIARTAIRSGASLSMDAGALPQEVA